MVTKVTTIEKFYISLTSVNDLLTSNNFKKKNLIIIGNNHSLFLFPKSATTVD